jgi:hypothetical protein
VGTTAVQPTKIQVTRRAAASKRRPVTRRAGGTGIRTSLDHASAPRPVASSSQPVSSSTDSSAALPSPGQTVQDVADTVDQTVSQTVSQVTQALPVTVPQPPPLPVQPPPVPQLP